MRSSDYRPIQRLRQRSFGFASRSRGKATVPTLISAILGLALFAGLLVGCGEQEEEGPSPQDVSVQATQAFFDRDFAWLARHASSSWVQQMQSEGYSGTSQEMISSVFDEEQQLLGSVTPPPEGQISVTTEITAEDWANQPWTTYKFDYTLSSGEASGGGGEAGVILEAESPEAEIPYRIVAMGIEYPGTTADGGSTALFGPYANQEFLGG